MEFTHFGNEHLIWLAICVLLCCGTLFAVKACFAKKCTAKAARIRRIVLFFVLFTHIVQQIYRIAAHDFNIGTLPIHVCSLAVWACLIYEIRPHRPLLAMLYCPFLPGAALAIIFPDWTMYPPFGILSITGFLAHVSIVIYILLALVFAKSAEGARAAGKETGEDAAGLSDSVGGTGAPKGKTVSNLRYRDLIYSLLFFAVYGALLLPFDLHFNVNYGFMNWPSPGSPLDVIAKYTGPGTGYRLGFAGFILIFVILWYLPYIGRGKSRNKGAEQHRR